MTERQIAVAKLTEQASHGDDQLRQHDKWQQELTVQEQALAQRRRDLRRRQEEAARLLTELSEKYYLERSRYGPLRPGQRGFFIRPAMSL